MPRSDLVGYCFFSESALKGFDPKLQQIAAGHSFGSSCLAAAVLSFAHIDTLRQKRLNSL